MIACYVEGSVLDENVDPGRAGFDLPSSYQPGSLMPLPSLEDIAYKATEVISDVCRAELQAVNEKKKAQIATFITEKRTEYRPLLGRVDEVLDKVPLDASDTKLDRVLSVHMAGVRVERRTQTERALKTLDKENATAEEIKATVEKVLADVYEEDRDNLAQHVATRSVVIDLFNRRLGLSGENKLETEDALHGLIFPMKTTSGEADPNRNHLWMIDERLSYHTYLASDVAMKSTEFLENGSPLRPDLNIFNISWTYTEDEHDPRASITVIEFKRPERKEYKENENPIFQVVKQIQKLRAGTVRNPATGRQISIKRDAPAYAYIVCDITDRLREWAEFSSLIETPDKEGYFGYNSSPNANCYIEIISFTKLVNDARKRNRILFDRLGI